jgi:hypothetical protein
MKLFSCDSHSYPPSVPPPSRNRGRDSLGQYLAQKSFCFLLIIDFRYFLEFCISRTEDGSNGCFAYLSASASVASGMSAKPRVRWDNGRDGDGKID